MQYERLADVRFVPNSRHHAPSAHGRDRLAFGGKGQREGTSVAFSATGGATMKLPRRRFLHLAAGTAALPVESRRFAWAQLYPSKPVRIVVGFASGSSSDILGRLIGQSLSEQLGQPFVIENRGGAGGTFGTETVVRAPPDGYTLLLCGLTDAFNTTIYDKLNFNFIRDIPRSRACPWAASLGGASIISSQDDPGIHSLCQSQSGQGRLWIGRHWHRGPNGWRAV